MQTSYSDPRDEVKVKQGVAKEKDEREEEGRKNTGEVHLPGLSIAVGGIIGPSTSPPSLPFLPLPPLPSQPLQTTQLQPLLPQLSPLSFPRQTNNRIAELKGESPAASPTDFSPLLRPGAEDVLTGLLHEKKSQPQRSLLTQAVYPPLEAMPIKKPRLDDITPERKWLQATSPATEDPNSGENNGLRVPPQFFCLDSLMAAGAQRPSSLGGQAAASPFQWSLSEKQAQPGTQGATAKREEQAGKPAPGGSDDDGTDTSEDELARITRDQENAMRLKKKTKRTSKPPPPPPPEDVQDSDSEKTEIDENVQECGNEGADKEHGRGRRSHGKPGTPSPERGSSSSRRQSDKGTMKKGPWTKEEDEALLDWVEKQGAHDWSLIAEHIEGRVGKQCRERYFNHLAPDVRKEAWRTEEDDKIIHFHHLVGNKWTNISHMLGNGRSSNAIKNRWHSSLKNKLLRHGGEATIVERTSTGHSCECKCTACSCTCSVACVALGCSCCQQQHWDGHQGP